jgi:mitochondrial fission protein ELM1
LVPREASAPLRKIQTPCAIVGAVDQIVSSFSAAAKEKCWELAPVHRQRISSVMVD